MASSSRPAGAARTAGTATSRGVVWAALGGFLLIPLLAACFVLLWPQALGLQRELIVTQAIAFRGPLLVGGVVMLLISLAVIAIAPRGRRLIPLIAGCMILAFVLGQGAVLGVRGAGGHLAEAPTASNAIRVMAWNTRGDEPGSPTIAELALSYEADVVALPETTEAMGEEVAALMREAGKPMWVLSSTLDEEYKWTATTILISAELGEYEIDATRGDTTDLPTVIAVPRSGVGPSFIAAHPIAPVPARMESWRSDLAWLAEQCRGEAIMAGDFNATLDHVSGLGEAGRDFGECDDAARQAGAAANGTWKAGVPPILAAPIDHVMATRQWRATGFEVVSDYDLAGSDHRPVIAELVPTS